MTEVIVRAFATSFDKDTLVSKVLTSLKKQRALHDTDLIWKINHKLRKRNVNKQDVLDLIGECLLFLNQSEVEKL